MTDKLGNRKVDVVKNKLIRDRYFSSAAVTRAAVEAAYPTAPIGSLHISTVDGRTYVKIADAGAAADWQKVTTTAAD